MMYDFTTGQVEQVNPGHHEEVQQIYRWLLHNHQR